jgi:fructose-specific phosphotransferase system IIC component
LFFLRGLIIGLSIGSKNGGPTNKVTAAQTVFASNTLKLAKEFACSCGTCGEKNLVSCTCDTAIGTKKFIESNLQKGIPKWEVVELVKNIYGHYVG